MNPPTPEILVIDDERQIRRLLRLTLDSAGYRVREAETARQGLQEAATARPAAVILDLGLPDGDGLDVLQRIREWSQMPVLILSVRGQESDKIAALDAGADDFLTKPFGPGELLARLRVLLRRSQPTTEPSAVAFGDVVVDFARRMVERAGTELHLTPREYALLQLLLRHRGRVLTHRQLLREIWGPQAETQTHYLRVYLAHLRQKLEPNPESPIFLLTEPGVGYRFAAE